MQLGAVAGGTKRWITPFLSFGRTLRAGSRLDGRATQSYNVLEHEPRPPTLKTTVVGGTKRWITPFLSLGRTLRPRLRV